MTKPEQMQAIEERAWAARKTMAFVCDKAGVYHSAWSRAKARGAIGVDMMRRMDQALTAIEAQS